MPLLKNGCKEMSVKTIPRSEFDQLLPHEFSHLESMMMEEVEWFSSRSGNLVGAVAKGSGSADWNYAILKRDTRGEFRVRKVMSNFVNLKAAKADLLLSMAAIEKANGADPGTASLRLSPKLGEIFAKTQ